MADAIDPTQTLADILAEHGPLPEADVVQRLEAAGLPDAEDEFDELIDETGCAAEQLIDDRWVWLPKLLAGRVFTHRLSATELAHDMLTVFPDLDPVTTLCENEEFARFVDGSPARVVLPMFDLEVLAERAIPLDLVHPEGALLLASGTLAAMSVAEGDLVGLRLTPQGMAIERVTSIADAPVGARFAALLDADTPAFFDAVVWTVCAEDPALFTQPLEPLSEIADDAGLPYDDEWIAPAGFDFDVWRFERGSALLARRYELDPDDAFALYTLLQVCDQMSLLLEHADPDEPLDDSSSIADEVSDVGPGSSLVEV